MLLYCKTILLLVNAITFRREFKNQIVRVFLFILLYYLQTSNLYLESEMIGIYQSLFHSTACSLAFVGVFGYLPSPRARAARPRFIPHSGATFGGNETLNRKFYKHTNILAPHQKPSRDGKVGRGGKILFYCRN
jgi:hypothetical protein